MGADPAPTSASGASGAYRMVRIGPTQVETLERFRDRLLGRGARRTRRLHPIRWATNRAGL